MRPIRKSSIAFACLALLGALLVTLGLLDDSRRIWFGEYKVSLEVSSIEPDGGEGSHAYAVFAPHGRWDTAGRPQDSENELLENGSRIGPAHSLHAEIRAQGGGRFSHWDGRLYFSTSDNSDPRTNKRTYEMVVPLRPPRYTTLAGLLISGVGLIGLGFLPLRRAIGRRLAEPGSCRVTRRSLRDSSLVFLMAATPSIVWLLSLPPSWNYVDSIVVMLYGIAPGVIPHFPPLYPILTRTANHWLTHLFEPGAATLANWGSANLSDTSLYGILVGQHLLFATAVTYFACVVAQTLARRLLAVVPFYLAPALSLFNHGIFSEGPWVSFTIIVLAAALHILRSDKPAKLLYLVYFLAWVPALLTRHVSFIFAFTLPATLLGLAVLKPRLWWDYTQRALVVVAVSMAAWYTVGLMNRIICPLVGVNYHSVYGRSGVYHITMVDWEQVPGDQREDLILSIQAKCSSPVVAGAVPVIFANRSPWTGTWNDVRLYVGALGPDALAGRDAGVLTDEILNEISGLFVRSWNPWYLNRVAKTLKDYGTVIVSTKQSDGVLSLGEASLDLYARSNQTFFLGVEAVDPAGKSQFQAMRTNPLYRWLSWWTDLRLICLLFVALLVGAFCRLGSSYFVLCAAGLVNLAIYFLLISLVTTTVSRYALAVSIVVPVLLGTVLANLPRPAWLTRRSSPSS